MRQIVSGCPDPLVYDEKKAALADLQLKAQSGAIKLYYQDESGFSLTPCIPYAWQTPGETIGLPTGQSPRINVVGFLGMDNDWKVITYQAPVNTDSVIAAIEHVFPAVKHETWLVMGNASIHKSKLFLEKINE